MIINSLSKKLPAQNLASKKSIYREEKKIKKEDLQQVQNANLLNKLMKKLIEIEVGQRLEFVNSFSCDCWICPFSIFWEICKNYRLAVKFQLFLDLIEYKYANPDENYIKISVKIKIWRTAVLHPWISSIWIFPHHFYQEIIESWSNLRKIFHPTPKN